MSAQTTRARVYNLGQVTQIPEGEGRTFDVAGDKVAVFRSRGGQTYATQANCPHRGGPLADGVIGGATVICPLHEYSFDLVSGKPIGVRCDALRVYPVQVTDAGELLIYK